MYNLSIQLNDVCLREGKNLMKKPIYRQIKEKMIESIARTPANTSISSERDLALEYQVSRMTVRKAVNDLVDEGYLYRDSNRGTFVADAVLRKKNTSLSKEEENNVVSYKIMYFDVKNSAPDEVQKYLNLRDDDSIVRIVRLALLDSIPQEVEEIYLNRVIVSDSEMSQIANWKNFNKFIKEGSLTQRFVPTLVPMKYAHLLNLKIQDPIIMIENFINNKAGIPLIYMKVYTNPQSKIIEITS